MSVAIRMQRGGAKKRPFYRIVVTDKRAPRDGAFIEKIGTYNPLLSKESGERVVIDLERAKEWMSKGAQPSDRVRGFLAEAGVAEKKDISHRPTKARKNTDKKTRQELKAESAAEAAAQAEEEAKAAAEAPVEETPTAEEAEAPAEEAKAESAEEAPAEAAEEEKKAE